MPYINFPIPSPLPTGISRTMIAPGKKKDNNPKQPYFTAHIGFLNIQVAKNVSINKHGEVEAYNIARRWRTRKLKDLGLTTDKAGHVKRKVAKQPRSI